MATDDVLNADPTVSPGRDRYVDFLRAASLFVVVMWHWVFTVVIWHGGPHLSNPIGTTHALWALTWVLQVMPVFFFVGGFAHLTTWESVERAGGGYGEFVSRRLRRLLVPASLCLAAAGAVWVVLSVTAPGVHWVTRGVVLVLSPLWFLGIYVGLVLLTPLAVRLHRVGGEVVPVVLAGGAGLVDILRFHYHVHDIELVNMLLVWGLAHQLGFFWRRLTAAPRRTAWCLTLGGFFGLLGLTNMGIYPRSMVGVPGEAISNMGPPTLCIVALALFQIGIVLLVRERVTAWLARPKPQRLTAWAGARAMTVYLWHFPGFAVAYGLIRLAGMHTPERTTLVWWEQRPLWAVAPAICIVPLVLAFRGFEVRRQPAVAVV
jgi:peptidoglycan/LPS O-acetylase OafA/YrhL